MKKYIKSLQVSRGVFSTTDIDIRPWVAPKPFPIDKSLPIIKGKHLMEPESRQAAQKKLNSIVAMNRTNTTVTNSSPVPNRKIHRSLTKAEADNLAGRLHAFWDNKWLKIEKKRKELADAQEKEFQELNAKLFQKKNTDTFNRQVFSRSLLEFQQNEDKNFKFVEAIEPDKQIFTSSPVKTLPQSKQMRGHTKNSLSCARLKKNKGSAFKGKKLDDMLLEYKTYFSQNCEKSQLEVSKTLCMSYIPLS